MNEELHEDEAPLAAADADANEYADDYADEYTLNDIGLALRLHALAE